MITDVRSAEQNRTVPVTGRERLFVAGLDLGQKQDYTAIAVIERCRTVYAARDPVTYDFVQEKRYTLTHVERLPLGTPYPRVVDHVREVLQRTGGDPSLVVDATGVGQPVVDLLRQSGLRRGLVPVTITGGERTSGSGDGYRVPKRDLVTGLQIAFETRSLEIAKGVAGVETLISELMLMRVAV